MSAEAAGGNIVAFLERSAAWVPDRPALLFGGGGGSRESGRRLTFGELRAGSERLAAGLRAAGLAPGDRAIVMVPMSPELYLVLLGLLRLGAVAVFVDPWIGLSQVAAFAAFAEPRAYLGVGRSHWLRLLDRGLRRLPITVTTGRRLGGWPARRTLAELLGTSASAPVHPAATSDPALITFTSGSSGTPKGADRTHGFLAAQHRALAAEFAYRDGDVDMPMFPVFALNNLALGIPSVVPRMDFRRVDRLDAAPILMQIECHGVTTATASPPFFDRLADAVESGAARAPRLRRILTGGAPVSDAQLTRWRRVFGDTEIVVAYGSTEVEPVAHLEVGERLAVSAPIGGDAGGRASAGIGGGYCVGPIVPRLDSRLVRIERGPIELGAEGWAAWEVAGEDGVGELVVRGDHVCRGYFRAPEAVRRNKIVEPSGRVWHRMGDTGYFDAEGRFWLVGRVHSTIFHRGAPVHAQRLEQVARGDDPRIRRAAAVGLEDDELGERVVVVLELAETAGAGPAAAELDGDPRAAALARLTAAGLPADEVAVASRPLPLDPRHRSKVDYGRLRRRLTAGRRRKGGR